MLPCYYTMLSGLGTTKKSRTPGRTGRPARYVLAGTVGLPRHISYTLLSTIEISPREGPASRHITGIASPRCADRLPRDISKTAVSTVCDGGLKMFEGITIFEMRMGL